MLSSRNEMFVVGALIAYLAFGPHIQVVRDLLAHPVGKVAALAGIIYVHKKVSCSVALLLVVIYLRCCHSTWEQFTTPTTTVAPTVTCPDGYALDSVTNSCKPASAAAASIPPSTAASVTTPPPNSKISTAPMTTPTPTMPPVTLPPSFGGVQPSGGSKTTVSPV